MRALCAKAIQSSPDWDTVCSRTRMQQFSSHLAHLSLVARLPMGPSLGKAAAFVQTWGLSWRWVRREPRAQLRALKGFWVHLCKYKVHSRRTSAYREYCGGLVMLGSFLFAPLLQNGQIPTQHVAKSDAGFSSGWIHYHWLQLFPILEESFARRTVGQQHSAQANCAMKDLCVQLCALAAPRIWRLRTQCVCVSLVSWEGQEWSSDPNTDASLLYKEKTGIWENVSFCISSPSLELSLPIPQSYHLP